MAVDINLINEAQALDLWADSPHNSVFTHPQVLSKLSHEVDWWQADKGNQPQCIWPICKSTEKQVELPALTYYVGSLWMNGVFPLPAHCSYFRKSEVNEGIIHEAFLGISPQERGKGLATALQAYTIDQLSRNKLRGISGNVLKANGPSVKMLLRTGFILTDDPDDAANYRVFYPLTTL